MARLGGGSTQVGWREFNNSRAGKLFTVLVVTVAFAIAWPMLVRLQVDSTARTPLPNGRHDDPCAVWFIGSSTVQRWDSLAKDMAPWKTVKRGVEGATFPQLIERLANDPAVVPPQAIVLYAGENDLANGAPLDRVIADRRRFLKLKTRMFGAVPVILVSLKPSPARWDNRPRQLAYNADARLLARDNHDIGYAEIGPLLMNGDQPGNYYLPDGMHLKSESYRLWVPTLQAALGQQLGTPDCSD